MIRNCKLMPQLHWLEAMRVHCTKLLHDVTYLASELGRISNLREAAGDRWVDASYLLGGWSGRKDARTGKLVDGPHESWKPDLKVVKASIRFFLPDWQTVSFFAHEGRVRCWLISRVMSAKALFSVVLGSDQGRLIRSPCIA